MSGSVGRYCAGAAVHAAGMGCPCGRYCAAGSLYSPPAGHRHMAGGRDAGCRVDCKNPILVQGGRRIRGRGQGRTGLGEWGRDMHLAEDGAGRHLGWVAYVGWDRLACGGKEVGQVPFRRACAYPGKCRGVWAACITEEGCLRVAGVSGDFRREEAYVA